MLLNINLGLKIVLNVFISAQAKRGEFTYFIEQRTSEMDTKNDKPKFATTSSPFKDDDDVEDKVSQTLLVLSLLRSIFSILCLDCVLYAVGKPVYHKSVDQSYGAWMKDPQAGTDLDAEKIWVTKENDTQRLYEYANKNDFRTNKHSKFYRLERAFHVSS